MAVFFDYPIQSPGLGTLTHHEVAWHSQFALLAVASKNESSDADGTVHFYVDEGHLVENASIQRSVVVECLIWHPEKEVIAIGWRSGEITTYNNHSHEFFEQSSIHKSPISVLQWNKTGSRLISGDKSGLLVVWKMEVNAQLHPAPLHQHRLPSPITHCAMLIPPQDQHLPGGGSVLDAYSWQRKSAVGSSTDSIACFCTSAEGAVCFLNNSGEWQERFKADSSIHTLLLQCNQQTMAVLTHDMVLTQFSVSLEGKLTQTKTAKLSGKSKATSIISIGDGVLASCSVENVVRFWDLDHGENYMLDLHQYMEPADDETVTDISFNREKGILAAGTSTGNVVMWQWRGVRQAEGAEKWEFLASSSLAAPVLQVKWGSKKHLLAANTGTGVQILKEHILCAHFNSQVSAVQVSPSDILVVNHVTDSVSSIKSDIHIKGTFVSKEYVAVWSGRKMVVYGISQDKSLIRVAGSFNTETEAAVIYEHSIYTIDRNQVTVRAFQGTVKQLLACGDHEGSPTVLGVSGHFLVAGTDIGWVKVWDLSRR